MRPATSTASHERHAAARVRYADKSSQAWHEAHSWVMRSGGRPTIAVPVESVRR